MAIAKGGINGPFKGKVGTVIGYDLNGQNVIRALPRKSSKNKRGSTNQNANRGKFKKIQHFLKETLEFIQVGFNLEGRSRNLSAHNAAKSYNLKHAFTPEGELDYAKVLVAYGDAPGPVTAQGERTETGIKVSWTNNTPIGWPRNTDQVMILAYHEETNSAFEMLSGARRPAGEEVLENRAITDKPLHVWMAFISDDRQEISNSTYLGLLEAV